MQLLSSTSLVHNNLLIAVTLIVLGFLGMLLKRNALATVFSLLIWLQGAGLVFISYSQSQESTNGQFYFLIMMLIVMTLLSTIAALTFQKRKLTEQPEPDDPLNTPLTREGTHPSG